LARFNPNNPPLFELLSEGGGEEEEEEEDGVTS